MLARLGLLALQLLPLGLLGAALMTSVTPPVLVGGRPVDRYALAGLALLLAVVTVPLGAWLRHRHAARHPLPLVGARRILRVLAEVLAWGAALLWALMGASLAAFSGEQTVVLSPASPGGCRVVAVEEWWQDVSGTLFVVEGATGRGGRPVGTYGAWDGSGALRSGSYGLTWQGEQGLLTLPGTLDGPTTLPVACG